MKAVFFSIKNLILSARPEVISSAIKVADKNPEFRSQNKVVAFGSVNKYKMSRF
jgi:hypothetical protein